MKWPQNGTGGRIWRNFCLKNAFACGQFFWKQVGSSQAHVAQLVEQLIRNEQVAGSNPVVGFNGFWHATSDSSPIWQQPMFKPFQQMLSLLFGSKHYEVKQYKNACETLVGKYEGLLKQISNYMEDSQKPLHSFEKDGLFAPEVALEQFQLNTFSLLAIKEELGKITHECETLLHHGSIQLSHCSPYEKTVKILLKQLKALRKYSDQIEDALSEFEKKLLKMEEVLSDHSLWN